MIHVGFNYHDRNFGDEFCREMLETKKGLEKDSPLSPLVFTQDSSGLSDLILEEESGSEKVDGVAGSSWRWLSFRRCRLVCIYFSIGTAIVSHALELPSLPLSLGNEVQQWAAGQGRRQPGK